MKNGFSLIEVLVFVSILGLVFIVGAALATISIQNSKSAENRILASRYGEELLDWLKGQKETNWASFVAKTSTSVTSYCMTAEPINYSINTWPSSGSCGANQYITGTNFIRQVDLQQDQLFGTNSRINVSIHVKWSEAGNNYDAPIGSVFAPFE